MSLSESDRKSLSVNYAERKSQEKEETMLSCTQKTESAGHCSNTDNKKAIYTALDNATVDDNKCIDVTSSVTFSADFASSSAMSSDAVDKDFQIISVQSHETLNTSSVNKPNAFDKTTAFHNPNDSMSSAMSHYKHNTNETNFANTTACIKAQETDHKTEDVRSCIVLLCM